jgi:hypothetical protein
VLPLLLLLLLLLQLPNSRRHQLLLATPDGLTPMV